jgi:hypothetical protein
MRPGVEPTLTALSKAPLRPSTGRSLPNLRLHQSAEYPLARELAAVIVSRLRDAVNLNRLRKEQGLYRYSIPLLGS